MMDREDFDLLAGAVCNQRDHRARDLGRVQVAAGEGGCTRPKYMSFLMN